MINVENVMSVYTGEAKTCMCGCKGNHRYASALRANASYRRGYVVGDDEVSDISVKRAVNRLNKLIDWSNPDVVEKHVESDGYTVWFDEGNRTVVAYLNAPLKV